jgi:threonine synthase
MLAFRYEYGHVSFDAASHSMWRYRELLPVEKDPITLGEGGTPLVPSRLRPNLYLKDETHNPTGSMKDRAMSLAFTKAAEWGATRSIVASTGSAGMAAAAYAARAGVSTVVLVPTGTARDRTAAMWMYGATVYEVDGTADDLFPIVQDAVAAGWLDVSTYRRANPYQSEAAKTITYEIAEDLDSVPDVVLVPVGGGGTLASIGHGFDDLLAMGLIHRTPTLISVQHAHFNSLERAMNDGAAFAGFATYSYDARKPCLTENLKHDVPPDGDDALRALLASAGYACSVTDAEILRAQRDLARIDGIFSEPSGIVGLAGLWKLEERGIISPASTVVVVITGGGLRNIQAIVRRQHPQITRVSVRECRDRLRL